MKKAMYPAAERAFTRVDLLGIVLVAMVLFSVPLLAVNRSHLQQQRVVDVNNLRKILAATTMYAADNMDHLPHPTWGTLAGPNGWAYAVQNDGSYPEAPQRIPSLTFNDDRSRQVPFFHMGQLGPYLKEDRVLECPEDVTDRSSGRFRIWYQQRVIKLTSYTANGAISGYGGRTAANADTGGTYKASDFRPQDVLFWEPDETTPFNWNDAASNPKNTTEGFSKRHTSADPGSSILNVPGVALAGRMGGSAEFVPFKQMVAWQRNGGIGRPNEFFCGPGFRR